MIVHLIKITDPWYVKASFCCWIMPTQLKLQFARLGRRPMIAFFFTWIQYPESASRLGCFMGLKRKAATADEPRDPTN